MISTETLTLEPVSLDIEAYVGEIIAPHSDVRQSREAYVDFVDKLQLPTIDCFRYVLPYFKNNVNNGTELLLPLVEDPYDSVVTEMTNLRDLSQGRIVHGARGTQLFDQFVTRTADETAIDATYRVITSPTINPLMTIETRLQSQLDDACVFKVANGALKILERRWRNGGWHDRELDVHADERGEKLLLGLVSSTLYAAHASLTRPEDERRAADGHAQKLAYTVL